MSDSTIRQAQDKCHDINRSIKDFFEKINDVLGWVPDFLSGMVSSIQDAIDALNEKLAEFWDRVNQLFGQTGSPDRLHQVAADWAGRVGNAVGDIAGPISPDKLQTTLDWQGRGAEAYRATVPAQVDGLNSVKDLAHQLRSSLDNLGNGIHSFWLTVVLALVGFGIAAVAAIAAACTVVGIPAAIAALLGGVGIALALIATAVTAVTSLTDTIANEQNTISQKIRDLGSDWAKSNVAAMQHKSDWHVMR
ncbi:hypothetical protein [Amycolatopsis sp. PS_44_ISF1]|uniref:hypothetical protein n=1 Tax=Amycolatopsis sp. PS_44_ISF1 TaxID=2974917 RepID=UPI0028DE3FA3|nr:hypothetical protein [Amycolatopsis sp. PS_44_ISF1]MDT8909570.1 hypothetical protein [Amycolatopsis sp. PS_44_ISF1]